MKVVLISTSHSELCLGLRSVSAVLMERGHSVRKVFLAPPDHSGELSYSKRVIDDLVALCQGVDLVGFSLMTLDLKHTDQVALALKKSLPGLIVVYGGIHAILRPESCLRGADIVCTSEGEEAIAELVETIENGDDVTEVQGFWHKRNGDVLRQGAAPLVADLDAFPAPDFTWDDTYNISGGGLRAVDEEAITTSTAFGSHIRLGDEPTHGYILQTSRGCPHRCTYCSNTQYLSVFRGKGKAYRVRSFERVIAELKRARTEFPWINIVLFYDDDLLVRRPQELEAFFGKYREEVGLPFSCMVSPRSVSAEKLDWIVQAGGVQIQMGIQSGSQRILKEVYKRPGSREHVLKALSTIAPFSGRLRTRYDMIFDNPYETRDDHLETLDLVARIPKPYRLQVFSLVVFPETELHHMLEQDGLLTDEYLGDKKLMSLYHSLSRNTYYKFLVICSPFVSRPLFRLLRARCLFALFSRPQFDRLFSYLILLGVRMASKVGLTGTRI